MTLQKQIQDIDKLSYNTIRCLSLDAINASKSGHPGLPLGMAPLTYYLWTRHLKHNPKNSNWINRDRFVLSAGHGSMLLYSLLHLMDYPLSLDDIKNFRQLGSKTPGHPESHETQGVEITTGPLGQGISNAVGMAISEKYLASHFNTPQHQVIDYRIYTLVGDGCLQEGISGEASSLAGHLGLNNLIAVYDDNNITIDGDTSVSFTEDVKKRYEAYGWNVIEILGDGHDFESFERALEQAKQSKTAPTLIKVKTVIGYGSPKNQGKASAHGAPFDEAEIKITKENYNYPSLEPFFVSDDVRAHLKQYTDQGISQEKEWEALVEEYSASNPEKANLLKNPSKSMESLVAQTTLKFEEGSAIATRAASGKMLDHLMPKTPFILGGSADLTGSNNTHFQGAEDFSRENRGGRYLRYGVREHAMGAILNGISHNQLLRAYAGTFLCFSDYMRASIRLAALSSYPSIFVFTHDSIGLGEDGPTHQPVEHLASLRTIPNLIVLRPADGNETVESWKVILSDTTRAYTIILSRQKLKTLSYDKYPVQNVEKGGYLLKEDSDAQVTLVATGSEVELIVEAEELLKAKGIKANVVSMVSFELFDEQSEEYRNSVFAKGKPVIAVEAGIDQGWHKYIKGNGTFIGMNSFGVSAPYKEAYNKFGITVENIIKHVEKLV